MSLREAMALFDEVVDLELAQRDARLHQAPETVRALVADMLRADASSRRFVTGMGGELLATDLQHDAEHQVPDNLPGYEQLSPIGQGGMGRVFEAWQLSPRRRVALKIIHPWLVSPRTRAWLRDEAEALGTVLHPGIPQIHAIEDVDGLLFLVMELVDGVPLAEALQDLDRRSRVELAVQIGEAVAHAHGRGLLHLDLKPDNVRVTPEGRAKVLDFGLARAVDAPEDGSTAGTPGFMAPEQREGARLDTRTDVFGFAHLLRFMLRDTPAHVDLTALIRRASATDPADRYPSMEALVADLRRFLQHRPLHARPPGPAGRLALALRRAPIAYGAALAIAITLVVASIVSLERARTAERARGQASVALEQAQQARTEAEEAASRAAATSDFLTEVFLLLNPENATGERTLLDATLTALKQLDEGALADAPTEAAKVRLAIAEALYNLGRGEEAEVQSLAAVDSYEAAGLPVDATLVDALHSTAIVIRINRRLRGRNDLEELERAFGYLERARAAALTLGDLGRVAEIDHSWGVWLYSRGDYAAAQERLQQAMDRKWALDQQDPLGAELLASTLHQLGYVRMMRGDLDVTQDLFDEALRRLQVELQSPHPKLATAVHWLADLHLRRGEAEQALIRINEATAIRDAIDQTRQARSRVNEHRLRSRALADLERWDEVETELHRVAAISFGEDMTRLDREDAWTLARLHLARGEDEAARETIERAFHRNIAGREGSGAWAWAFTLRGRLGAALGDPAAVEDLDRALSVWQPRFTERGPRPARLIALRQGLTAP